MEVIQLKNPKLTSILTLTLIYTGYLAWDYIHHQWLEINVSKNMTWLAFRYYNHGGSFQYSWDLLILTPLYIGLLLIVTRNCKAKKSIIIFACLIILLILTAGSNADILSLIISG